MPKTLVIHIGVHKTGSTAVQHYLWRNEEKLRKVGILYPTAGRPAQQGIHFGHHEIPWFLIGRKVPNPMPELDIEIQGSEAETIVISSEEFDRIAQNHIEYFFDFFSKKVDSVKVIFFYRRQSDVIQGMYGTDIVWNRYLGSFEEYIRTISTQLDYLILAQTWAKVIGHDNVIVRPYLRSKFTRGNLVSDFCEILSQSVFSEDSAASDEQNPSLPWYASMTVQHMWRLGFSEKAVYSAIPALVAICRETPSLYDFIPPSEAAAFDGMFERTNREFHDEFCPSEELIAPRDPFGDDDWYALRKHPYPALIQTLEKVTKYVLVMEEKRSFPPSRI